MRGLQSQNHTSKEIFGSRPIEQFHFGAVTLEQGAVYAAGTVMSRATATGRYIPYITLAEADEGDPAGSAVAVGILQHDVDATQEPRATSLILVGAVKESAVTNWDARAADHLFGRVFEGEIIFG